MYISRSSEINTYADDTQFFTSGQDPVTIQHRAESIQADLQSASEWFQSNGMGLNVDKCLSMWVGSNSAFSHDVTAAILAFQDNETAAMLVYPENPLGVELFSHVNFFFCSNKLA